MNWNFSFGKARRLLVNTLLAGALATGVSISAAGKAEARHHWVGPFIIGAFIGAAIVDQAYRHHHPNYAYGHPRKVHYRRHHPKVYYYPQPVFAPMIGIYVPWHW